MKQKYKAITISYITVQAEMGVPEGRAVRDAARLALAKWTDVHLVFNGKTHIISPSDIMIAIGKEKS